MLACLLERYDGEHLVKFDAFYNSSGQFSLLQILEFALYRLSNNMLSTRVTENFVRWLIAQKHNELFVSFLRNKMPIFHACATRIPTNALWIGDVNFLRLLINSGIDTSSLNGV